MEQTVLTLEEKIDRLSEQVQYLTGVQECAERRQAARAELFEDAMPIANEAFRLTVEQLEEIQDYVDLTDLLHLAKRLMRNTRNLDAMLDQFESVVDLGHTVAPLVGDAFEKTTNVLEQAEQNGYFTAARGGARVVHSVVTSFGEEDMEQLADNMVLLLGTVKGLTRPEVMRVINAIVAESEAEIAKPVNTSLTALLKQMRDPDVRRGLALTMRLLGVVGKQAAAAS
jgi:uncharacterized protein YjgD (DUF1641 family)